VRCEARKRVHSGKAAPVSRIYFNEGQKVVRDVALVFPAPVRSYSLAVSEAQQRLAGSPPRTEVELHVDAVSFVPSADGSEILVLRVAPTYLRARGPGSAAWWRKWRFDRHKSLCQQPEERTDAI
jgi:hypothetical protein